MRASTWEAPPGALPQCRNLLVQLRVQVSLSMYLQKSETHFRTQGWFSNCRIFVKWAMRMLPLCVLTSAAKTYFPRPSVANEFTVLAVPFHWNCTNPRWNVSYRVPHFTQGRSSAGKAALPAHWSLRGKAELTLKDSYFPKAADFPWSTRKITRITENTFCFFSPSNTLISGNEQSK